jgi:hypothetical protein
MNREPAPDQRQWSVAAIAADPAGAFTYMRELILQRNTWHRKFDESDKALRLERRAHAIDREALRQCMEAAR